LGFFLAQRVGALENLDLRVIERNASTLQRREPGHGIVQSLAKLDRRAIEVSGGGVTLVERNRHVDHRLGGVREDGLPNVRERQQQVLALLDGAVTSRRNVLEAFGHRPDLLGTDAGLVSGRLDDRSRRSLGFLELEGGIDTVADRVTERADALLSSTLQADTEPDRDSTGFRDALRELGHA